MGGVASYFGMKRDEVLAVLPAEVFVFALSGGADPGLGAVDALTDSRLGKTGGADFGKDVFPVHSASIANAITYVNAFAIRCAIKIEIWKH